MQPTKLLLLSALLVLLPHTGHAEEATSAPVSETPVSAAEPAIEETQTTDTPAPTKAVVEPEVDEAPAPESTAMSAQDIAERYASSLVRVHYSIHVQGQDSVRTASQVGVVVGDDGIVMVPGHLQALNAKPFGLKVNVGDEAFDAELLRRAGSLNVSYVQLKLPEEEDEAELPELTSLAFDEPVELAIGEPVWVLGLLPQQAGYERLMRRQYVSAVLDDPSRVYVLNEVPLPGEAGALVVTMDGKVAGVQGYELSQQQGGEVYVRHGLPLIFPNEAIAESLALPRDPTQTKETEAWFGILVQPLKKDFAEYFGIPDQTGCIISNVVGDSPAEKAGLLRGDIITELDGDPVDVPNDLALLTFTRGIRDIPIGTTVEVAVLRDGEPQTLEVTLESLPTTAAKAEVIMQPAFGIRVREITRDIIYIANLDPGTTGVIVDNVETGSPAQAAGLRPGDVIRQLDGQNVSDLANYLETAAQMAMSRPEKIVLFVQRRNRTGFTTIEPDWSLPIQEDE